MKVQPLPPVFPGYLNKINVTQKGCNSLSKNQVPSQSCADFDCIIGARGL